MCVYNCTCSTLTAHACSTLIRHTCSTLIRHASNIPIIPIVFPQSWLHVSKHSKQNKVQKTVILYDINDKTKESCCVTLYRTIVPSICNMTSAPLRAARVVSCAVRHALYSTSRVNHSRACFLHNWHNQSVLC